MNCPHLITSGPLACRLISASVPILTLPDGKNPICPKCQAEWRRGTPPTSVNLTPTLQRVVAALEPGLLVKAANYARAEVRHTADLRREVDEETYWARLAVCRKCALLDRERMVCRQPECGCKVEIKARWASEACPIGKWERNERRRGCCGSR